MSTPKYILGEILAECDGCGFEVYLSELKEDYKHFKMCSSCWEPEPMQLKEYAVANRQHVPYVRPPQTFTTAGLCTFDNSNGIVGYTVVGCTVVSGPYKGP